MSFGNQALYLKDTRLEGHFYHIHCTLGVETTWKISIMKYKFQIVAISINSLELNIYLKFGIKACI